ncbi:hypothetical protein HWV62_32842 [Athelia sp. TMB]|nr:hypothetical protein HWV62_32842 [Athelia sp. TMB]
MIPLAMINPPPFPFPAIAYPFAPIITSMDNFDGNYFDTPGAKIALEHIVASRIEGRSAAKQLAAYAHAGAPTVDVLETEWPKSARMAWPMQPDCPQEEAVLRIQGIICKAVLPPKRPAPRSPRTSVRYLEQSFTLTGLNTLTFNMAIDGVFSIAESFGRQLDNMTPWHPGQFEGFSTLTTSNRLFTKQSFDKRHQAVPVEGAVDPIGSLIDMAGEEYVHTEDNVVRYLKCLASPDGKVSYTPSMASAFKPGDIVEAQISLVVLPSRNGQQDLKLILRAMTMLDDSFSKAARIAMMKSPRPDSCVVVRTTCKRKPIRQIGYDDDCADDHSVNEVSKRVKSLQVTADTGE